MARRVVFSSSCLFAKIAVRHKTQFTKAMENHLMNTTIRHQQLSKLLQSSDLSPQELRTLGKELSGLTRLVQLIEQRVKCKETITELKDLEKDSDKDIAEMATLDREKNEGELNELEVVMMKTLIPEDSNDECGVVVEVRAGTGGDEASLFAGEVYCMYENYARLQGWKWEQLSQTRTDIGGFKEAQASVSGEGAYGKLKYESGVHRVQRVPVNDARIQTSAASVVVLPEPEEVDVELRPQDLKIDVFRAGGAGGQSVNRTESAVRITHLPTGLVVSMQDERSQIQNRARAMKYLRAKVYEHEQAKAHAQRSELRSLAHGTGDRSDKIRTYNFPQDRVTDHRAGLTITGVSRVLSGEYLDRIFETLVAADQQLKLKLFLEDLEKKEKAK